MEKPQPGATWRLCKVLPQAGTERFLAQYSVFRPGILALRKEQGQDRKDKLHLSSVVMLAMNASGLQPAPDPTPFLPEGVFLRSSFSIGSALEAALGQEREQWARGVREEPGNYCNYCSMLSYYHGVQKFLSFASKMSCQTRPGFTPEIFNLPRREACAS